MIRPGHDSTSLLLCDSPGCGRAVCEGCIRLNLGKGALQVARDALEGQRGPMIALKKLGYMVGSGLTFARLFLLPTQANTIPDQVRMQPAW